MSKRPRGAAQPSNPPTPIIKPNVPPIKTGWLIIIEAVGKLAGAFTAVGMFVAWLIRICIGQ